MDNNKAKSGDAFKITGNWDAQSKQLKSKYAQLTDADLKYEVGKENELLGRVEHRLNMKRNEVIEIINGAQARKEQKSL